MHESGLLKYKWAKMESFFPTTSGSSRKGSNAIFLGKSTYEK